MGHQIPILLADAKNTGGAVNSHQKPHHAMPGTAWAYRQPAAKTAAKNAGRLPIFTDLPRVCGEGPRWGILPESTLTLEYRELSCQSSPMGESARHSADSAVLQWHRAHL
ncbi:hypothetical protein V499_01589 [Pseudogymnoascus sp. VKM F-103]|nr:hypothetical protein V499_01589 [Pseudogymnoascus sp. VKM F-103]